MLLRRIGVPFERIEDLFKQSSMQRYTDVETRYLQLQVDSKVQRAVTVCVCEPVHVYVYACARACYHRIGLNTCIAY